MKSIKANKHSYKKALYEVRRRFYLLTEDIFISNLYKIGNELGYSVEQIKLDLYNFQLYPNFKNNCSTSQDNKYIRVGSGNSNKNKIRYHSKKRSRSTWKRFYTLFPEQAIKDNWDGKTSDKM